MVETTIAGVNEIVFPNLSAWGWEIALYLFLGGLVAGLMILGGAFRLSRSQRFERAAALGDLIALPLLGLGMLLLFIDLSSKANVWRLYTTFQVASPMSWGSWILLLTMALLALRFVSQLPAPGPIALLGVKLFAPAPRRDRKDKKGSRGNRSSVAALAERSWGMLHTVGSFARRYDRALAGAGVLLGVGVGFYTGVLLSSIDARPLWGSAALAPLFLVSGVASGAAFICLFLGEEEHVRLVPFSVAICGIELLLLLAYLFTILFGSEAARQAGPILFGGSFGLLFWGIVVFAGLLVPAAAETMQLLRHQLRLLPARVPPMMKLMGGAALRFVVVYAGLRCFM